METVNDGQFHSVELVMLNQTLNLVVDKGAPKSLGKLQKQPAVGLNSPLYLGGKAPSPDTTPALYTWAPAPGPPGWGSTVLIQAPLAKPIREGFLEAVSAKQIPKG